MLTLFDGNQNPLDAHTMGGPGVSLSQASFDVIGGQTYFLRAAASPSAIAQPDVGAYTLGLSLQFSLLAGREVEPNDTRGSAAVIGTSSTTVGTIRPNDVDLFAFIPPGGGRLTARVHARGANTRLSLLDEQGRLLVQSDKISLGNRENRIDQYVVAGTYYLKVESLGGVDVYSLETELIEAPSFQASAVGGSPADLAYGDFNGDGRLDLATTTDSYPHFSVSVLLGRGDGTFREPVQFAVGESPSDTIVAGDFNGDGRLDLATTTGSYPHHAVSVLLGRGDGTFQGPVPSAAGEFPGDIVAGDFNGDGHLDLATASEFLTLLANLHPTLTRLGVSFVSLGVVSDDT